MDLTTIYLAYIACLNSRELDRLGDYVAVDAVHNGRALGLAGYRAMIEGDYRDIPDLRFTPDVLVADASTVACRLRFDCHPRAAFLELPVDGRRVVFHENVFYRFAEGKIREVWSLLDRDAIAAQLETTAAANR